jgi:hypothetical protein
LLYPPWWLLPPLLPLFPVILTVSKNIMKPARVPNTAQPVKTVAGVVIVLKTVALAAFAGNFFNPLHNTKPRSG